ncbi:MAG: tetratricopeptide repeat protein [Planctomycetota bacterium]|nr:MAG: tetratricopeptide repeat protein [Planctomycetota bacterium]
MDEVKEKADFPWITVFIVLIVFAALILGFLMFPAYKYYRAEKDFINGKPESVKALARRPERFGRMLERQTRDVDDDRLMKIVDVFDKAREKDEKIPKLSELSREVNTRCSYARFEKTGSLADLKEALYAYPSFGLSAKLENTLLNDPDDEKRSYVAREVVEKFTETRLKHFIQHAEENLGKKDLTEFKKILARVYYDLGKARFSTDARDLVEADALFDKALELYPGYNEAMFKKAEVHRMYGRYNEANEILGPLIEREPANVKYIFTRAHNLDRLGNWTDAIKDFERGLNVQGYNQKARKRLAELKSLAGKHEDAIKACDELLDGGRYDAEALYMRGKAKYDKGDYAGALADLAKAIKADPEHAGAYLIRGHTCKAMRKYKEARKDYDRAVELNPKNAVYHYSRGDLYKAARNYKEAIKNYDESIKLNKFFIDSWNNRGLAKYYSGDYDEAIKDYTKAMELDPFYARAYFNRGLAKRAKGDYGDALKDFAMAIEIGPAKVTYYFYRGNMKRKTGDLEGALADASKEIELFPKNQASYMLRGAIKLDMKKTGEAKKDFDRGIRVGDNRTGDLRTAGQLLFRRGLHDDALPYLSKIMEASDRKNTQTVYTFFMVCIIRARTGKPGEMRKEAGEYLKLLKQDEWAAQVMKFFAGKLDEAAFMKASETGKESELKGQECEACYYIAEMRLASGDKKGAKKLLEQCIATGERKFTEYISAKSELKRLNREEDDKE